MTKVTSQRDERPPMEGRAWAIEYSRTNAMDGKYKDQTYNEYDLLNPGSI